jgi:hypothetical protein
MSNKLFVEVPQYTRKLSETPSETSDKSKKRFAGDNRSLAPSYTTAVKQSLENNKYNLHLIAQQGNLDEFKAVFNSNPQRLHLKQDPKKWMPIHFATTTANLDVMEFIIKQCPGNSFYHLSSSNNYQANGSTSSVSLLKL